MICLLCLTALFGCSFGMAEGTQIIPENDCRSDSDCSDDNSVCDLDRRICVSKLSSEKDLLVEIVPKNPSGSPLPSQYFVYEGETNRAVEAPFTLRDTISIGGWVKWGEDSSDYRGLCTAGQNIDENGLCIVDAKIELIPAGEFPESERQTVSVKTSNAEQVRADPAEVAFEITAVPGIYSLRVVPEPPFNTYLPPLMFYEARYLETSETLIVRYEPLDSQGRVDGIIRNASGDPIRNISVWAVDPVSGRRISSIATIDSESQALPGGFQSGEAVESMFRLYMDPQWLDQGDFMVHIASEEEAPTIPSIKFGPFSFPEMDGLVDDGDPDYINFEDLSAYAAEYSLMLPAIGVRVQYQASVEGVNPDGTVEPLEGVRVKFLTDEIGEGSVSGSYEISGTTNIDGQILGADEEAWAVWLLEGSYAVTLYPPLQSPFEAVRITDIPITANPDEPSLPIAGQVFQLQAKRGVIGQILTVAEGEPAGAMTLEAYPLISGASGSGVIARFNTTQSDDEGFFELALDHGTYDLLLMPDPGSNFPWLWKESVSVDEGEGAVVLSVQLPDPAAFRATALDADGEPLVGAEVKMYEIGNYMAGEPVPTRQIARTTTRSDGTFLCLIAPDGGSVID